MAISSNVSAVFLQGQIYENELNILLSVPNDLRGDVRDLAGNLGFDLPEIQYIFKKEYPFVYMLDQWIKRTGAEEATLDCLYNNLKKLERLDAADIIEKAIVNLSQHDLNELDVVARRHNYRLKRSESNVSLCPFFPRNVQTIDPPPDYYVATKNSVKEKRFSPGSIKSLTKSSKDVKDDAPSVYVVYVTENNEHLEQIRKLVEKLRSKCIDARTEEFESIQAGQNQGYYIYSKLIEAEYVLLVCTTSFEKEKEDSDQGRKAKFILKLMLDFIYEHGPYNSKYIPVLLPDSRREHIPFVLRGAKSYDMGSKEFYDDLLRRIFKIEKYQLSDLSQTRPKLKPINVRDMF